MLLIRGVVVNPKQEEKERTETRKPEDEKEQEQENGKERKQGHNGVETIANNALFHTVFPTETIPAEILCLDRNAYVQGKVFSPVKLHIEHLSISYALSPPKLPPEPPPIVLPYETLPLLSCCESGFVVQTCMYNPGLYLVLFLPHSSCCESAGVVQTCIYNPQQQAEKETEKTTTNPRKNFSNPRKYFSNATPVIPSPIVLATKDSDPHDIDFRPSIAHDTDICTSVAKHSDLRTFIAGDNTNPGVYKNLFTEAIARSFVANPDLLTLISNADRRTSAVAYRDL